MQMRAATLRFHCFLKAGKQEGSKNTVDFIRCRKVKNNGRLFIHLYLYTFPKQCSA